MGLFCFNNGFKRALVSVYYKCLAKLRTGLKELASWGSNTKHGTLMMNEENKDKRKQHCTACRNHDITQRKTAHKCPFERCECLLCQLTQTSRTVMRHQQRLWRHLKDKNPQIANGTSKKQVCDKCRNHGVFVSKRNHKGSCPRETCDCALCGLTNNRRDIMRHQQRVRRSGTVTSTETIEHQEAYDYVQKTNKELRTKFGDISLPDGNDGYSSDPEPEPEERPPNLFSSSPEPDFHQDGTKFGRYRKEEGESSSYYEHSNTTSKKLAFVKQEAEYPSSSFPTTEPEIIMSRHVKEEYTSQDSPASGFSSIMPPRYRDYNLSQSLPPNQLHPQIIPIDKIMYPLPRDIGPRMSSYPINLLPMPRQAQLYYTAQFNRAPQHPIIQPPFHQHP